MTVDHEYLTNKPKFMQKEQYNLMHSKKPMILPESMTLKLKFIFAYNSFSLNYYFRSSRNFIYPY